MGGRHRPRLVVDEHVAHVAELSDGAPRRLGQVHGHAEDLADLPKTEEQRSAVELTPREADPGPQGRHDVPWGEAFLDPIVSRYLDAGRRQDDRAEGGHAAVAAFEVRLALLDELPTQADQAVVEQR